MSSQNVLQKLRLGLLDKLEGMTAEVLGLCQGNDRERRKEAVSKLCEFYLQNEEFLEHLQREVFGNWNWRVGPPIRHRLFHPNVFSNEGIWELPRILSTLRSHLGEPPEDQPTAPSIHIEYPSEKLAIVTEGDTTVEIRGERRVWLLRNVVEAEGRAVTWTELRRADLAAAGAKLDRRQKKKQSQPRDVDESLLNSEGPRTPRVATKTDSLQRLGNHLKRALDKLGYHWHQDGQGVRWDPQVK